MFKDFCLIANPPPQWIPTDQFRAHFSSKTEYLNSRLSKNHDALEIEKLCINTPADWRSFLAISRQLAPSGYTEFLACGFSSEHPEFGLAGENSVALAHFEGYKKLPMRVLRSKPHQGVKQTGWIAVGHGSRLSHPRKALFLDRDGILIKDTGYPIDPQKAEILENTVSFLKKASEKNYTLVVVTNQSGLARGYFNEKQYREMENGLHQRFLDSGVKFEKWYHSPYHIDGTVPEFSRASLFRKPSPGMLLLACNELGLSKSESIMIGDRETDRVEGFKSFVVGNEPRADVSNINQILDEI